MANKLLHCWESGPETEDGCSTTCMLEDGHACPHQWTRDDQIRLSFESPPPPNALSMHHSFDEAWFADRCMEIGEHLAIEQQIAMSRTAAPEGLAQSIIEYMAGKFWNGPPGASPNVAIFEKVHGANVRALIKAALAPAPGERK